MITQKLLDQFFFYKIQWKGGTWATEEAVRLWW